MLVLDFGLFLALASPETIALIQLHDCLSCPMPPGNWGKPVTVCSQYDPWLLQKFSLLFSSFPQTYNNLPKRYREGGSLGFSCFTRLKSFFLFPSTKLSDQATKPF